MGWKRPNILGLFLPWAPKTTPFGTFRAVKEALERAGDSEGSHQRRHGSLNATLWARNLQILVLEAQLTRTCFLCPTPSSFLWPGKLELGVGHKKQLLVSWASETNI